MGNVRLRYCPPSSNCFLYRVNHTFSELQHVAGGSPASVVGPGNGGTRRFKKFGKIFIWFQSNPGCGALCWEKRVTPLISLSLPTEAGLVLLSIRQFDDPGNDFLCTTEQNNISWTKRRAGDSIHCQLATTRDWSVA